MLTLALLRHAKSSWDSPSVADFDRPLNARGRGAAPEAGMALREFGLKPGLVLSSPSARTRETWALAGPELKCPPPEIVFDDALYHASAAKLLERVQGVADRHNSVLVIGHNPGLHGLALSLAGGGVKSDIALLTARFPTAAIAFVTFTGDNWRNIAPSQGLLAGFWTPRRLRE